MAKKAGNKSFILNDESKVNSYGFRVMNNGIDLERFKANPVILDLHNPTNASVIGRWTNIRVEGSLLLADPEFDMEDPASAVIAGKVDRGFLKGASIGFGIRNAKFEQDPAGVWLCTACEIFEASIVPIPSNANAVKLYGESQAVLSLEDFQLSIQEFINPINLNMNKLILSVFALTALGLQNAEDNSALAKAIEDMAAENKNLKADLEKFTNEKKAAAELNATALVDKAIVDGKLTAAVRENWIALATNDLDSVTKSLEGIPGRTNLSEQVENSDKFKAVKTDEDFMNLSESDKALFKTSFPEAYAKLFA